MKVFRGLESPVGKDAKGFAFAVQRIVGRVLDEMPMPRMMADPSRPMATTMLGRLVAMNE